MPWSLELDSISVDRLVQQLGLQPHPEGGWYREFHRSGVSVQRSDGERRAGLTQILFLLPAGGLSRWHRVLGADEAWHFVAGDPLELWILPPQGGVAACRWLGPLALPGTATAAVTSELLTEPVVVVPADWWQAARCPGRWSLVSCCVGPGFDFRDFELLDQLPPAQHPSGACSSFL
ncbi:MULTISPECIES: cupin domain-containing protein [Aphanothece]|uniref:cupin domain-containing protein n=1 Tax=Aphanothece TaxID=1121 RepID=UPI003984D7C6